MTIPEACGNCSQSNGPLQRCSKCKLVSYCNSSCQTNAWPLHKIICKSRSQKGDASQRFFKINVEADRPVNPDLRQKVQTWIKINLEGRFLTLYFMRLIGSANVDKRKLVICLTLSRGMIHAHQVLIQQLTKKE